MTRKRLWEVWWTEQAASVRDSLDSERRSKLDAAIVLISEDPYVEPSRPRTPADENDREIRLTSQITAEYIVSTGRVTIIMMSLFDNRTLL